MIPNKAGGGLTLYSAENREERHHEGKREEEAVYIMLDRVLMVANQP